MAHSISDVIYGRFWFKSLCLHFSPLFAFRFSPLHSMLLPPGPPQNICGNLLSTLLLPEMENHYLSTQLILMVPRNVRRGWNLDFSGDFRFSCIFWFPIPVLQMLKISDCQDNLKPWKLTFNLLCHIYPLRSASSSPSRFHCCISFAMFWCAMAAIMIGFPFVRAITLFCVESVLAWSLEHNLLLGELSDTSFRLMVFYVS